MAVASERITNLAALKARRQDRAEDALRRLLAARQAGARRARRYEHLTFTELCSRIASS